MTLIEAERGDITAQKVDVVVNAANSTLLGGGGVDGAIHSAAGLELWEAVNLLRRDVLPDGLPVGDAVATTAGKLPARWIVHTVGPRYRQPHGPEEMQLASCHRRSLEVAHELGARSVAFPAISCGIFGYPPSEAAPVAVRVVRDYAREHPGHFDVVRFVLFSDDVDAAFRRALADLAGDAPFG
jgi:O-acetyl-ADP-ribose deacetylase (regulator of RNase III)